MGFSRQEYWSGLPLPSPGELSYPGFKPMSPSLAGRFSTTEPPGKLKANIPHIKNKLKQQQQKENTKMPFGHLAHETFDPSHAKSESESEVAQSCPTLCDPMDCSPPGSAVHGIFQARILEWGATAFSRGSSRPRDRTHVSMSPAPAGGFFTMSATWAICWEDYCFFKKPNTLSFSGFSLRFQVKLCVTGFKLV